MSLSDVLSLQISTFMLRCVSSVYIFKFQVFVQTSVWESVHHRSSRDGKKHENFSGCFGESRVSVWLVNCRASQKIKSSLAGIFFLFC